MKKIILMVVMLTLVAAGCKNSVNQTTVDVQKTNNSTAAPPSSEFKAVYPNWKFLKNTDLGFEFQYPASWIQTNLESQNKSYSLEFKIPEKKLDDANGSGAYFRLFISDAEFIVNNEQFAKGSVFSVGGIPAYRLVNADYLNASDSADENLNPTVHYLGQKSESIMFYKSGKIYQFEIGWSIAAYKEHLQQVDDKKETFEIFNKVLGTFKFVN